MELEETDASMALLKSTTWDEGEDCWDQGSISKSGEGVKQKKRHTRPAAAERGLSKRAKIALRIAEVRFGENLGLVPLT